MNRGRVRRLLREARLRLVDGAEGWLGRRADLVPPRRLVEGVGGFDFTQVGEHLAQLVERLTGLRSSERILDIGCGVGRLAVPLTGRLSRGEYLGFDLSEEAIDWCRRAISPRFPNFHFVRADIANSHYNLRGRVPAERYRFPCADRSIDVAFASSVFTHLSPLPADRYLEETARVLKPGGRAALSFFLLDEAIRARRSEYWPRFLHEPEPFYAVADPEDPDAAIAYDESTVRAALERHGFEAIQVFRGSWLHLPDAFTFQDFVVARRAEGVILPG